MNKNVFWGIAWILYFVGAIATPLETTEDIITAFSFIVSIWCLWIYINISDKEIKENEKIN